MRSKTQTILWWYGGAAAFTALAVLLRWLLDPWLGDSRPFSTLFGAVALAVWIGGYRPALLAVILGFLACAYLFVEPRGKLLPLDARNLIGLVLSLFSCAAIIVFGEALRTGRGQLKDERAKGQESEAAHQAAMQQLQIVTESMAAPVTRCSRDLTYLWVSKPYADWMGRSPDEIIGRPIEAILGREAFTQLRPHFEKVLAGHVVRYEEQVHYQGIGPRWINAVYTPTLDASGVPNGWVAVVLDISERRQMEEALRHSEQRFARFMEQLPGLAWIKDLQGRYVYANEEAVRVFRCTRDELYGKTDEEVFPPETAAEFQQNDRKALANGTGVQVIEILEQKDGIVHHSLVSKFPILGADGNPALVGGMAIDITDRLRAEEVLAESEERFRQLAENINEVFWMADPQTTEILYISPAYERVWGRSCQNLSEQPRSVLDAVHPDDRERVQVAALEKHGRGESTDEEYRVVRPDGSVRWVRDRAFPVRDAAGQVYRMVGIAEDITDRVRAEETSREANAILRSFYDTAPMMMGVVEVCADGILHLSDNAAMAKFFGRSPEALRRQLASQLGMPAETIREWIRHYRESERTGVPVRFEYTHQTEGGARWLSATVYCIERLAESRIRCSYVVEDVTERKQAQEVLKEADRRKDEFLATLAHELRNPLAPIRNSIELLRLADGNADLIRQAQRIMERQLAQIVRLVDDLLDISRITRGKLPLRKKRIELAAAIQTAIEAARPAIAAQAHELSVTLPPDTIYLDGDPTRLAQVFSNLLNNAAKYTEKGGHIWLTTERQGNEVVVSVRDTGIGIATEHLPKLFAMFSQIAPALERSQGGLGVGLALVRGLVELHGGNVEAHSAGSGRGSEFTVRLPVVETPGHARQEPSADRGKSCPGPKCRILVADDLRDSVDSLAMMLRVGGHDIQTAHDGLEAVQAAATFRPDVVVLDIGMPRMNGYEAARHIRQQPWGKQMLLIALTGWGQEEDKRRAFEAGFDNHLTKPVEAAALEKLLALINPVQRP
jgi:PAS domain S-box-containing protein